MSKPILLLRDESSPTGWREIQAIRGLSAYQTWLKQPGNAGKTEQDFLYSLVGSVEDGIVAYTPADERTHLASGEKVKITFGKIAKWLSDLKGLAFKDKVDWNADVENPPTSMPASDVSAWAKATTKPSYAYSEITGTKPPADAQKNSNITKGEIEAKLTGVITTHSHTVTKANVGLGNVDNTSDASKPVSTATQAALSLKADKSKHKTATLTVENWIESSGKFIYTVSDADVLDNVVIDLDGGTDADFEKMGEFGFEARLKVSVGSIQIKADTQPTSDININYAIKY